MMVASNSPLMMLLLISEYPPVKVGLAFIDQAYSWVLSRACISFCTVLPACRASHDWFGVPAPSFTSPSVPRPAPLLALEWNEIHSRSVAVPTAELFMYAA